MARKSKIKKPVVIFCELRRPADEIINISSQNGAESVVTRMLPKSHVSHVILNANVSEDRFLDMKVSCLIFNRIVVVFIFYNFLTHSV